MTLVQNILLNYKLSEYHTGYRAFDRKVLERLPLEQNSDDFVFDNEILAQAVFFKYRIGEISCPTKYFPEASSITFPKSVRYGLGVLTTCLKFRLQKMGLGSFKAFSPAGNDLGSDYYRRVANETNEPGRQRQRK